MRLPFAKIRSQLSQGGNWIFWSGILIALIPIWQSQYFLTEDGPCHLHNARMLLDHFKGDHTDFYSQFYTVSTQPNSNWTGHLVLVGLLAIFPPWLAEKVFLSGLVLVFAFGVRYAVRAYGRGKEGWAALPMLFLYSDSLHRGFYNFVLSLAVFFWLIGFWERHKDRFSLKTILGMTTLVFLQYFTHPITFLISLVTLMTIGLAQMGLEAIPNGFQEWSLWQKYLKQAAVLAIACIPAGMFFISVFGASGESRIEQGFPPYLQWVEFTKMNTLVFQEPQERVVGLIVFRLLAALAGLGIAGSIYKKWRPRSWGWGLATAVLMVLCILSPDGFAGGSIIQMRMHLYPVFALALWLAVLNLPRKVVLGVGIGFLLFQAIFLGVRISTYRMVGEAVQEIRSVQPYIEDESVVLPLSFNHRGLQPDGQRLTRGLGLFIHASDYLGAEKPLVMLDNYEGAKGYFPLNWKPEVNPFIHLGRGPGQEHNPPGIDLRYYIFQTQVPVKYVLEWCRGKEWPEGEGQAQLKTDLEELFELAYVSPQERVRLWKRKE